MSSEETEPPQLEVETVGIDEIVRQERVRSIFESRRDCRQRRTKAKTEFGVNRDDKWKVAYRSSLESYIREVEPLFSRTSEGHRCWNEHDFGAVDLTPRHEELKNSNRRSGRIEPDRIARGPKDGRRVHLRGLRSLFELETPHRAYFEVVSGDSGLRRGDGIEHVTVERDIPMRQLDEMFAVTNGYLAKIGLGVEVGKASQNTKLDDDLLEEVDQWRRENL